MPSTLGNWGNPRIEKEELVRRLHDAQTFRADEFGAELRYDAGFH